MDDTNTLRNFQLNHSYIDEEAAVGHNMSQKAVNEVGPAPPSPPEVAGAKKIYLSTILGGTMMIILIIFSIFSIFWGALYQTTVHTHNLVGWIVDFDQGAVGNAVISAVREYPMSPTTMTWVVKDASEFPGGPEDLANSVHEQHVWFAISVNPGVSNALAAALQSPQQNTNYSGSSAITAYGEEARSENGFRSVVRPQFEALMQPIVVRFASQFVAQNVTTLPATQVLTVMRDAPQVVTRPIYYTLINLRPFDVPVATAVTFVGLIYLLILSFMVTMISAGGREASGLERSLPTGKLVAMRFATNITVYFFLSLFYCLLSLAFQAPFDRHLGKGGFVVYWMLQWIGMLALGFALETMMTLLTAKFIPVFLILWIISDVSVAFLPIELLPGVFRYGYAMPFYNISQGVRVIIFGTKNELGLNFGVLFAWAGVSTITLPLSIIFVRRKSARSAAQAQAQPLPRDTDAEVHRIRHVTSDETLEGRENPEK